VKDRMEQLQRVLIEHDLAALVLRLPENIVLTAGWWVPLGGLAIVVIPQSGRPAMLVPDFDAAEASSSFDGELLTFPAIRLDGDPPSASIAAHLRELASRHGAAGERIGYEGSFEQIAPCACDGEPNAVAAPTVALLRDTFRTSELVDATSLIEEVRSVKTPTEVERIRRTNEIAMLGLDAFHSAVRPDRTEVEVAADVAHAIATRGHGHGGARVVRAYPTVFSGPDLAERGWQYFRSRQRVIERGDVVMVELAVGADGYWSDHTRTVVAGGADATQRDLLELVRHATSIAFAAARPDVTGGYVDRTAREFIREHGFEQFPHHTGHGTGFRYHESRPQLTPSSHDALAAGQVIAGEPGIYHPGLGGFRWEENAVVAGDGAVPLAVSPDWQD
jgi:Xaa-Pro aminopeptidase